MQKRKFPIAVKEATYRSRNLKEIDYYESEAAVSDIILKKYKLEFTYKGRKDGLYCQRLMDHIRFNNDVKD